MSDSLFRLVGNDAVRVCCGRCENAVKPFENNTFHIRLGSAHALIRSENIEIMKVHKE